MKAKTELRPSFTRMPKTQQLELLGKLWELIMRTPNDKINLNTIAQFWKLKSTKNVRCACIAGHAGMDEELSKLLQFTTRNDYGFGFVRGLRKNLDVSEIFTEEDISLFLFGGARTNASPKTEALNRILYLGWWINGDRGAFKTRLIHSDEYSAFAFPHVVNGQLALLLAEEAA